MREKDSLFKAEQKERRNSYYEELKEKYKTPMDKCDTGICDMLVRHHDKLVDDPERLTTDFILELCCTRPQKLEDYKIKRAFQIFSKLERL